MAKCLWITEEAAIEYKAKEHIPDLSCPEDTPSYQCAWKFLYWCDGGDGDPLLIVCGRVLNEHANLLEAARALAVRLPQGAADGCGDVTTSGSILSWFSDGFRVDTPEDLKPAISDLLGVNR